ncbi:zinc finger MYM-type protein 1-like [Aphis gossypii]|uniref:zinc finger MYM-type protein 1-like n=1 Tax=Aphis gossypii TaxID=80765 RepID=UPI002159AC5F|nr:zinc finger MYM-type protein 1-like [Aphis gossypii]
MKALNEINLNTNKPDERNEAIQILSQLNLVSKLLQSKNVDLLKATDNLKNAKTNLEQFRNGYENAKANALNIASKWKVNPEFSNKRKKIIKKHFDELAQDFSQLHNRFVGMNEVCNLFNFMSPSVLISLPEKDIMEYSQKIQLRYSNDLSAEFPLQLVMLVSMTTIKEELAKLNSIKEFLEFLIKQPLLTSSVPEVATALILFLTLPVTSANAERSFSKLKLIKNYLRSTQEQERLSDLAILAIEAKEAEKMDIKELIKTFSELKARKKNF